MCKLSASLKLFEPLNAVRHGRCEMGTNGFQIRKNEDKRFRYLCTHAGIINSFLWKVNYYQSFAGSRNFLWLCGLANQLLLTEFVCQSSDLLLSQYRINSLWQILWSSIIICLYWQPHIFIQVEQAISERFKSFTSLCRLTKETRPEAVKIANVCQFDQHVFQVYRN